MKVNLAPHSEDLKDIVFDFLDERGVDTFTVRFDGSGDSGQIEDIELDKELLENKLDGIKVPNGIRYSQNGAEQLWTEARNLEKVIESVCYQVLEQVCSGWEINDGSYGEFTFDVKKRKVSLDFNERITDVRSSTYKF